LELFSCAADEQPEKEEKRKEEERDSRGRERLRAAPTCYRPIGLLVADKRWSACPPSAQPAVGQLLADRPVADQSVS
jgi:hypothetical protein